VTTGRGDTGELCGERTTRRTAARSWVLALIAIGLPAVWLAGLVFARWFEGHVGYQEAPIGSYPGYVKPTDAQTTVHLTAAVLELLTLPAMVTGMVCGFLSLRRPRPDVLPVAATVISCVAVLPGLYVTVSGLVEFVFRP
jgi:hypothetical protein